MSDGFKAPITKILAINPHPNADKLAIATVYGFQVIVGKDVFVPGDEIVYVPIDSILSKDVEDIIFPSDSKMKLNNGRVRQVKIRSAVSQGMVIKKELIAHLIDFSKFKLENDVSSALGITKFEPPPPKFQSLVSSVSSNSKNDNPMFHKYNGLENIKWMPTAFAEGEEVVIQEKMHGSSSRIGIAPLIPQTTFQKLKQLLGFAKKHEYIYGSNNVQIARSTSPQNLYGEDVYGATLKKIDALNKLKPNEVIYGEVIGPGIQGGYDYGLKEPTFLLFDVILIDKAAKHTYLGPNQVARFAQERGFAMAPVLYAGPYNNALAHSLTKGPSAYSPKQKVREGIVIKKVNGYDNRGSKQAFKWLSEDYLDNKGNTDYH